MKEKVLLLALLLVPVAFCQNETAGNESQNWYDPYLQMLTNNSFVQNIASGGFLSADTTTIITILIGLVAVYIFGKIAFSLIKWAIIILVIYLLFRLIF